MTKLTPSRDHRLLLSAFCAGVCLALATLCYFTRYDPLVAAVLLAAGVGNAWNAIALCIPDLMPWWGKDEPYLDMRVRVFSQRHHTDKSLWESHAVASLNGNPFNLRALDKKRLNAERTAAVHTLDSLSGAIGKIAEGKPDWMAIEEQCADELRAAGLTTPREGT